MRDGTVAEQRIARDERYEPLHDLVDRWQRSNAFYKKLFGVGIRSYQGPTAPTLAIGPTVEFLMFTGGGGAAALRPAPPPRPASINHSCMNMDNFNVEQVQKALESFGIKPRAGTGPAGPMQHYISMRMENRGGAKEGTPELYFTIRTACWSRFRMWATAAAAASSAIAADRTSRGAVRI